MAVVIFGLLIGIHEFGHFITAKMFKMRVNEFAIGMGPAIFKKQGKSTLYSLRIFPLGGYCALEGEDGDSEAADAFGSKPAWQRVIVLCAGSLMNFLAGLVILLLLYAPAQSITTLEIAGFTEGFTCSGEDMLMEGDVIKKINGYTMLTYSDITIFLEHDAGKPYNFTVQRDDASVELYNVPLTKQQYTYTIIDEDGLSKEIRELRYGISFVAKEAHFTDKIGLAVLDALDFARLVKVSFFDLFGGAASVSELTGPVGIASMITETARVSMQSMWLLVALIAVNLAVMNLLPIPALDGGRILFLVIGEIVYLFRRKPLNPKYEGIINTVFLVALLGFMVFVSYNDIVRLIKG